MYAKGSGIRRMRGGDDVETSTWRLALGRMNPVMIAGGVRIAQVTSYLVRISAEMAHTTQVTTAWVGPAMSGGMGQNLPSASALAGGPCQIISRFQEADPPETSTGHGSSYILPCN